MKPRKTRPIALDARRAAEFLAISERKFHLLRKTPGFPAGRQVSPVQVRFLVSELEEWLAAQPVAGKPEPVQLTRGRVYRSGQPVDAPAITEPATA